MAEQTEAEYFAFRAKQCHLAGKAATDPGVGYANRELARRYHEWSLASAAKASGAQAESAGE
jgi:hypothetical protein